MSALAIVSQAGHCLPVLAQSTFAPERPFLLYDPLLSSFSSSCKSLATLIRGRSNYVERSSDSSTAILAIDEALGKFSEAKRIAQELERDLRILRSVDIAKRTRILVETAILAVDALALVYPAAETIPKIAEGMSNVILVGDAISWKVDSGTDAIYLQIFLKNAKQASERRCATIAGSNVEDVIYTLLHIRNEAIVRYFAVDLKQPRSGMLFARIPIDAINLAIAYRQYRSFKESSDCLVGVIQNQLKKISTLISDAEKDLLTFKSTGKFSEYEVHMVESTYGVLNFLHALSGNVDGRGCSFPKRELIVN